MQGLGFRAEFGMILGGLTFKIRDLNMYFIGSEGYLIGR